MSQTKNGISTATKHISGKSAKSSKIKPGSWFIDGKGQMYLFDEAGKPHKFTPPKVAVWPPRSQSSQD